MLEVEEIGVVWDGHSYMVDGEEFSPVVFDAHYVIEEPPGGFNAVKVYLDGRWTASLEWQQSLAAAARYSSLGKKILWDLDLGLFSQLTYPLSHQGQLRGMLLTIDHFLAAVWEKWREHSLGVVLYRGSADFSTGFLDDESGRQAWIEELESNCCGELPLFAYEYHLSYIHLLVQRLYGFCPYYLLLDVDAVKGPLLRSRILSSERYDNGVVAVSGGNIYQQKRCGWKEGWGKEGWFIGRSLPLSMPLSDPVVGVVLPAIEQKERSCYEGLNSEMVRLESCSHHYRVIPEALLATSWDGLDYLIAPAHGLTESGKRMLQGFCAAGGTIIRDFRDKDACI